MNLRSPFILLLIAAVAAGAAALYLATREEGLRAPVAAPARVTQLSGTAQVLPAGEAARLTPLAEGDRLGSGDVVRTGPDGSVTLRFADGSVVVISGGSRVAMRRLLRSDTGDASETVVRVESGSAESRVSEQNGVGARYQVSTPALRLAVRGTSFSVNVDAETGETRAMVREGEVVASGGGEAVTIPAGYGTFAKPGKAPSAPRKLLDAPRQGKQAAAQEQLPVHFTWKELAGAKGYRVQAYSDADATRLALDTTFDRNEVVIEKMADADYSIRVRGIDEHGLEGRAAEFNVSVDAHPVPPEPRNPAAGDTLQGGKVEVDWVRSDEAESYLFQVANGPDFSDVVTEVKRLPASMGRLAVPLRPGTYYWRIASVGKGEEVGPFIPPKRFVVAAE